MSMLRDLFGPSRDEIWQQFAAAVGGSLTEGGFMKGGSKVQAAHGQWMVTLDNYVVSTGKSAVIFTRMRAPYVNPDGFQFTIYRRGIFSDLGKWLGMQDVNVGVPQFDADFVIKGNDEAKLRRLFADARLRDLINAQPNINFSREGRREPSSGAGKTSRRTWTNCIFRWPASSRTWTG